LLFGFIYIKVYKLCLFVLGENELNKNIRNLLVYLLIFILTFQQVIQGFAFINVQDEGMGDTMLASPTPVITIFYSSTPTGVSTASPSIEEIPTLPSYETPIPTETLTVTYTPITTESSVATHTPIPTETLMATHTPVPTESSVVTYTPIPTETPAIKVLPKPDGLSLEIIDNSSVKLSWNKVNADVEVKGYDIYRNDTKIGTTDALEYIDTGLTEGTSYNYYIIACDVSGNVSEASDGLLLVLGTTTIKSDVVLTENRVYQNINLIV